MKIYKYEHILVRKRTLYTRKQYKKGSVSIRATSEMRLLQGSVYFSFFFSGFHHRDPPYPTFTINLPYARNLKDVFHQSKSCFVECVNLAFCRSIDFHSLAGEFAPVPFGSARVELRSSLIFRNAAVRELHYRFVKNFLPFRYTGRRLRCCFSV